MLGAVVFGHDQMQVAIKAINELAAEAGKPKWSWVAPPAQHGAEWRCGRTWPQRLGPRRTPITEKQQRLYPRSAKSRPPLSRRSPSGESPKFNADRGRHGVLQSGIPVCARTDPGRTSAHRWPRYQDGASDQIRTGVLARTHGSALFTRGETQALVVTTLGTGTRCTDHRCRLTGERKEPFMLHYNFPPFSVGETGMMGSPKRREIGHGNLAKRGVKAVMPDMEKFPYVIRVVSEILESNGSSSMASVCGSSLALMDAGVPIKAPVAGVAMGLVKEG